MTNAAINAPGIAQLGKYRIEVMLGEGAMGIVYRAFDPHIERQVAIKTVRRELFESGERASLIARLRNEAQAAGRLAHPNIVGVYDYGETADTAYIAMELVEGRALKPLLDAGRPLELATALDWFSQLLAALDFAHTHGVVHRDIKPANLLVNLHGRLKVADFGVAHVESSTLTLAGAMIGTPSYMSPEQCAGEPIDCRSDLFSAAIVLYQMLTGRRPFVGASHVQVMQQLMHETPLAPSIHNPSLPSALDGVVLRALSRRPADRFQTADALRSALADASRGALPMSTEGRTVDGDDCTLLEARTTRPAGSLGSGTGAWPAPGFESGASLSSLTMWPAALLGLVQARLAEQIGPVARLRVWRADARYGRDTVANIREDKAGTEQVMADIHQRDGMPIEVPDLRQVGLKFKRVQRLYYHDRPLIQMVYLPQRGDPVALCVIEENKGDAPVRSGQVGEMKTVTWRANRLAYVLLAKAPSLDLQAIGNSIATGKAAPLYSSNDTEMPRNG